MKYLYILLICLILFYILSRFFEKYYSQENFDPSLVPVSSIITLAKVAQKIVDGNGTLTNPANLNIGTPNGPGNLLVTGNSTTNGNSTVDGNSTVGGTLGVTGATTVGGTLGVTGASTIGGTLGVTGASTIGGTLGVTGATTVDGTLGIKGNTTIGIAGIPATTTSLTVNGATKITGNTQVDGNLNTNGKIFANGEIATNGTINSMSYINCVGDMITGGDIRVADVTITGPQLQYLKDMTTNKNITLPNNNQMCIGAQCLNEGKLARLLNLVK